MYLSETSHAGDDTAQSETGGMPNIQGESSVIDLQDQAGV